MPKCERCGYKNKDVMQFVLMEYIEGEEDVWICDDCSLEVSKEQREEKEKVEFT